MRRAMLEGFACIVGGITIGILLSGVINPYIVLFIAALGL